MHYNFHRYYEPQLGRYITSDPIGLDGGMNTYVYVRNSPINLVDKHGLHPHSTLGGDAPAFDDPKGEIDKIDEQLKDPKLSQKDKSKLKKRKKELQRQKGRKQQHHSVECGEDCQRLLTWTFIVGVGWFLLNLCTLGAASG